MNRPWVVHLVGYGCVLAGLAYVFSHMAWDALAHAWQHMHWPWFAGAVVALILAQGFSVARMRFYARALVGLEMGFWQGWRIYMRGMWLNLWLLGGMGGDGWKVWHLTKQYNMPWPLAVKTQFAERLSGLLALMLLAFVMMPNSAVADAVPWPWAVACGLGLLTLVVYGWAVPVITGENKMQSAKALGWSVLVQLVNLAMVACLCVALGLQAHMWDVLVVSLIVAAFSVVPVALGGVGMREFIYMHVAVELGVPVEPWVLLGLVTSLCYAVVGLLGLSKLKDFSGHISADSEKVGAL